MFEGALTALVTPFKDGAIDFPALTALVESQIAAGIHGLVAVGTTGESATVTVQEHLELVAHVVQVADKRVPVIGGAGANSTAEAIRLSVGCCDAGVDGLLHVTPYYNRPTQQGLYRHFAEIAATVPLPIVLYNVPTRTGCDLLPDTVAELADLDNVVAIKEATGDMRRAGKLIELVGERLTLLSGDDFTAMPLFALGGRGVISVVSNVAPAWMVEMCNAAQAGNWNQARILHYKQLALSELLFREPNPIPVKAAVAMQGLISPEIRSPLTPCSEPVVAELRAFMTRAGLL